MMRIASMIGLACLLTAPAGAGEPARAENVIVVTLDGFRPQDFFGGADETLVHPKAGGVANVEKLRKAYGRDTAEASREAILPFLWGTVAKQGQVFGDASKKSPAKVTNGRKFSYPGYSEMFCGFPDDRIDSNAKKSNPNGSILEFLDARPAFRGKVAAFCTWDVFPSIFRSDSNGLKVHSGWTPIVDEPLTEGQKQANLWLDRLPRYWADNVYDAVTMAAAREHLLRHKPRVLYIGLGETDEWAHGRRYDLYLDAAHAADRYLGELWEQIQAMPEYAGKTALLVTTDHGRGGTPSDWTSHGEKVDGAEAVWMALIGPGVPSLGVREGVEATQSQVAATIAGLVGEDYRAASPKSAAPLAGAIAGPRTP
ncbi:alkaline phosphatase family protein [Tundrisphaera sp. TA3]|uniref:alkaline phosphatase family protein n=1 Tax=Tundrisphaera sp. TA3 TaxID=3435775 RepID=UPI003EB87615